MIWWWSVCICMCVYKLTRISASPFEGKNTVLILANYTKGVIVLRWSLQRPTEAAVKPTKYRGRGAPGNWKGNWTKDNAVQERCWLRWFSNLSSSPLSLNSIPSGLVAPSSPLKASKSPDCARFSSPYFSGIESGMISRSFAPLWRVVKGQYIWYPKPGLIICYSIDMDPI